MKTRIGRDKAGGWDGLSSFFHPSSHGMSFLFIPTLASSCTHRHYICIYVYINRPPSSYGIYCIVLYANQTKEMDKIKYSIIRITKRISLLELLSFPLLFSIERAKRGRDGIKICGRGRGKTSIFSTEKQLSALLRVSFSI